MYVNRRVVALELLEQARDPNSIVLGEVHRALRDIYKETESGPTKSCWLVHGYIDDFWPSQVIDVYVGTEEEIAKQARILGKRQ